MNRLCRTLLNEKSTGKVMKDDTGRFNELVQPWKERVEINVKLKAFL